MYNFAECVVCGFRWEIGGIRPNFKLRCEACKATPEQVVKYGDDFCIAWQGDFDPESRPMMDGEFYLPGVRLCGHRDCIRLEHIVPFVRPTH